MQIYIQFFVYSLSLYLQVAEDFAFSLYELDWDVFSHNIGGAINRIPAVETTGVKSTVCGPGTDKWKSDNLFHLLWN